MTLNCDSFDDRATARLKQLAASTPLAEACEIVAHEMHEWTLTDDGWAPRVPDVPVLRVYEIAATLATTEAERQSLQRDILTIARSVSLTAAIAAEAARKRSENGKAGGAALQVTDAQFIAIAAQWDRDHPNTRRGLKKWASSRSGLSVEQTGKRIQALIDKGEI